MVLKNPINGKWLKQYYAWKNEISVHQDPFLPALQTVKCFIVIYLLFFILFIYLFIFYVMSFV